MEICLLACLLACLLTNRNKKTMEIRRSRTLAVKILKNINEINPLYAKNIFPSKGNLKVRHNDIMVKRINTSRFGTQSLRSWSLTIWKYLPSNIKSEASIWTEVQMGYMHKPLNKKWFQYCRGFKAVTSQENVFIAP